MASKELVTEDNRPEAGAKAIAATLKRIVCVQAVSLLPLLLGILLPVDGGWGPRLAVFRASGVFGIAAASLLLALTAVLACLLVVSSRRQPKSATGRETFLGRLSARLLGKRRSPAIPKAPRSRLLWAAGWPQGVLIAAGSTMSLAIVIRFWPRTLDPSSLPKADWYLLGAGSFLLAFLHLICERFIRAANRRDLPEQDRLAAILTIPMMAMSVTGATAFAAASGLPGVRWALVAADIYIGAVAVELGLRTLSIWFSPPPREADVRAAIGSVVAGLLQPGYFSSTRVSRAFRDHFSIDLSRSWAIAYASRVAPAVVLGLLLCCWGLSGVKQIAMNERGSYEKFGAPIAILKPGLHLLAPWPIGHVRRVEYGVIHAIPIGYADTASGNAPDISLAEDEAPAGANRLWDQERGTDASYIIASESRGEQSFGTVSVDLRVIYRVGLDDQSARDALYRAQDIDSLIRQLSGRLLAHFFAERTLEAVLDENRETVVKGLGVRLQQELDRLHSGVEILSVIAEAIHPPTGAASAYRGVQAAEITASTTIAEEKGRAVATLAVSQRDAHDTSGKAKAAAAELLSAAELRQTRADADIRAYKAGGPAFLMERYFSDLRATLGTAPLEIVDHRLQSAGQPILDLRPGPVSSGAESLEESKP